jgi:uncharacterized membrane protein (UPF0127 family)
MLAISHLSIQGRPLGRDSASCRRAVPFWQRLAGVALAVALAGLPLAATAAADDTRAVLHTSKGAFTFTIEIADTEASREQGLMYRKALAPDAGMLFDFHSQQPVEFWMVNTLIPLDMIFIAADGTVKTIHANAVPEDATPIPSGVPVQFVFEIAGGRAAQIGIKPGDRLEQARVTPAKP